MPGRRFPTSFPAESYTAVDGDETRLREIGRLQQRSRALETELAHQDEFLALLSHELRTPVNAILGWIQIASGRRTDGPTTRRALEVIGRNAALQMHLIDDLLDVSRIVTGKMQISSDPVDLGWWPRRRLTVSVLRPKGKPST